ncbi:hypothetical protein ABZY35_17370, partial [Nocardiopsis alba]
DTLRLFEKVVASGKNLAFMAHFSHPNEMRERRCGTRWTGAPHRPDVRAWESPARRRARAYGTGERGSA